MCDHGDTVMRRVIVAPGASHTGKSYAKDVAIDRCIADLVDALNNAGILTANCCCGHGKGTGSIALHDGRWLWLMSEPPP